MRVSKQVIYLMLAATMLLSLAACGQKDDGTGGKEDGATTETLTTDAGSIKIGAIFAQTGGAAFLGVPEAETIEMMVADINTSGGINGRKIELLMEDTKTSADEALSAVKKLVKEGAVVIIGPTTSGVTMAVKEFCNKAQVPLVSCAAAEVITNPMAPYVFKTAQKDTHAAQRIYDYMVAKGIKKVALISATSGFGAAGRTQLNTVAAEYPTIEIVADETYGPADTDMTAQLLKIKESGAEAIVNWSIVPAQSLVLKDKKKLQMDDIAMFQSHGFSNIEYVKAAGDAAEGVVFPASRVLIAEQLPENGILRPLLTGYKSAYEAKTGKAVSAFGGYAHDAMNMVVAAIESNDATREGIRDGIEALKEFKGASGIYNMTPEDHTGLTKKAFVMLTVKDGKFTLADQQ